MITFRFEFLLLAAAVLALLLLDMLQQEDMEDLRVEVMKARTAAEAAYSEVRFSKEVKA